MAEFKAQLRNGELKMGLFLNSASTTVCEQISHLGFDWVLIDGQHAPLNTKKLSALLCAIASGGAKSMVRVASPSDRAGVQQALDLGADGVLIPYVNNAEEVRQAVSFCRYPPAGTRSVYFPQRSTNKDGLLGYVGNANKNIMIAIQIETADSIKNMDDIAAVEGVDILFLGQNDLCMSMGLFEKYQYPDMYFSKELQAATDKLISAAKRNSKILGLFLFGTDRVAEFIKKGFTFVSIGNDLHFVLTQAQGHMKTLQSIFPVAVDSQKETTVAKTVVAEPNLLQQQRKTRGDDASDESANVVLAVCAVTVVVALGVGLWRTRSK
jgi:4-hydroxy-2-oxoheptanedioate aldolase